MAAITTILSGLTASARSAPATPARPTAWARPELLAPAKTIVSVVPPIGQVLDYDLDGIVHVLTCGSVDDGKSTLIGRLLWDAGDVAEDQRATLRKAALASGNADDIDYSLLLDGLLAEREQGITIDIAWRSFDAATLTGRGRRFVVIDSPGHEQYTRNMASGASHADVAVMLVDARSGIKPQTRRHAAILDLVGVGHVVLAVNKMDLVDNAQARFEAIAAEFLVLCRDFRFRGTSAIPVSAKLGHNVVHRARGLSWYNGPTLIEHLGQIPSRQTRADGAFRFPVQSVLRGGQDFRGLAGRVTSGMARVGNAVRDTLTGRESRIARIVTMDGDLDAALAGRSVVLQLESDIDVSRGAVLALPEAMPTITRQIEARLVWLGDAASSAVGGLLLRTATDLVPVARLDVMDRLDLGTMRAEKADTCRANDIVTAGIVLSRSAALDAFEDGAQTGAFVLVDALTGATVAGGVVTALTPHALPSSGKTFKLTHALLAQTVCADLPAGMPARAEFRRRASEVAFLLSAAGAEVELEEFEDGGGI